MDNPIYTTAAGLAAAIAAGKLSSSEAVEAHFAQIEARDGEVNAMTTLDREGALVAAREADAKVAKGEVVGPLHGVPITIKDAFATKELRTTAGWPDFADHVPDADAPTVARLRAAGAVIIGKTNMPPLGQDFQTYNEIFGETKNPWNLDCTPGGSTGGGAAAVAAGFSPLELGSDIGGSVRIPPHYCGCFSMMPTEWRTPVTGHLPDPLWPKANRYMLRAGIVARDIADLRTGYELTAGPDGIETEVPPVPLERAPHRSLQDLRIGWIASWGEIPATADTQALIGSLAQRLADAGATVEEGGPADFDYHAMWECWSLVLNYMSRAFVKGEMLERLRGMAENRERYRVLIAQGARQDTPGYFEALNERDALIRKLTAYFGDVDVWITPVSAGPAFRRCKPGTPIAFDGKEYPYWQAATYYSALGNVAGLPAVVIPLGRSADGLPIGCQIMGPRWGEAALLDAAGEIAAVTDGFRRPPGY
jgi:amidase